MSLPVQSPRRRPALMASLVLVSVALAGICVGVAIDRRLLSSAWAFPRELPEPPGLESSPALRKAFVMQLARELELSDTQRAQVEQLIERERPKLRAAFDSARTIMQHAVAQPQREMMQLLTPAQQAKFQRLLPPL